MPIFGAVIRSYSVAMATGDDLVIMKGRIAKALGIRDGDVVEFDLVDVGDTVRPPVKIKDNINSDVLIHDWSSLGIASRSTFTLEGLSVELVSGKMLFLPMQEMWACMRVVECKGTVVLHFDGASRGNPKGRSGYAFALRLEKMKPVLLVL